MTVVDKNTTFTRVRLRTPESKGCISVARPTIFGNPFTVEDYGRIPCIRKFREYLKIHPALIGHLVDKIWEKYNYNIKGVDVKIGCYCALDEQCHADVYVDLLNILTKEFVGGAVQEKVNDIKCGYRKGDSCMVASFLTTGETKCNPHALYCKLKNKDFANDAVQGNLKIYDKNTEEM